MIRANRPEEALRRIAAGLDAAANPWALIGGLAVSARAEPRTTREVDVAVSVVLLADLARAMGDTRAEGAL